MKKFLVNVILFAIPIIILLLIPFTTLLWSKENFYSIDNLIIKDKKYLIGYGYQENNYGYLKWKHISSMPKKSIVALGSSRVLQFRDSMFTTSFYNAGYTIKKAADFQLFLHTIPKSKYPDYLIIGLDQWMFNDVFDSYVETSKIDYWENSFSIYPNKITCTNVTNDILIGKYSYKLFLENNTIDKIGLNALTNNTGFINDGSMFYGNQITKLLNNDTTALDYNFSNTYNRIDLGTSPFQFGKEVSKKAIVEIDKFLYYCKSNNIKVIAFLPPYADKVYQKMIKSEKYNYVLKIYNSLKPVFEKYNYEVYDYSNSKLCNSSDSANTDGFHGSETTYQSILINMLDLGCSLKNITDKHKLIKDLANSKNYYSVY